MRKVHLQMIKQKYEMLYDCLKKWEMVLASVIVLFLFPITVSGQTFVLQGAANNPFQPAGLPIDIGTNSAPTFVDIDSDSDFDLFLGTGGGTIKYYENTGNNSAPTFTEQTGGNNPLNAVAMSASSTPTSVDIDNDGDFDVFIGSNDGSVKYYKNTGNNTTPTFVEQTGTNNPLNVDVGSKSVPTFVDIDSDGDFDAFIGENGGTIKYYQNTGNNTTPTFVEQTGSNNSLNIDFGTNSAPTFVDIDSDGDFDAIIGTNGGTIHYYKNTGNDIVPIFTQQTGGSNPFSVVVLLLAVPTFVDIDNEGNLDACIGASNGQIYYFENTSPLGCISSWRLSNEASAPKDKYLNFDGVDDLIFATQQTTVTNNFTMEFWVNPTATTTLPVPANPSGEGYGSALLGQRYVIHPLYGGPHVGAATLANGYVGAGVSVGTNGVSVTEHGAAHVNALLSWSGTISGWTHIAIVYTNKQPSLYINGVLTTTGLQSQKTSVYVTTTEYGGGYYGYFNGGLDELRIWDYSLTAGELLANKDTELTGNESGLLDYYQFNEANTSGNTGITTLIDATNTPNNGTLSNFALAGTASNWFPFFSSTLSPPSSQNLNFDGENDNITATQQTGTANDFTIEFWAKPTETISLPAQATSGTAGLSGQRYAIFPISGSEISFSPNDAGAGVSVGTNGVCVLEHGANYLSSLLTWSGTINGWTHIAVVYTTKQPSLYINGILVATGLQSLKSSVYPTTTGYGGGQYGYFKGYMDELRIWSSALSAGDILANKDSELVGNEVGLMDYYNFNQGVVNANNTSITTLTDATATTNNGTLNNFVLIGNNSNWTGVESVTIASDDADNTIPAGTSVTFTASLINGGTSPSYKWEKNGIIVGIDSDTYTDATLIDGDKITVETSSVTTCPLSSESNSILITVTGVLPVELISFTARAQDNRTNLLEWRTASEENNEGFDIERSKDGLNFEKIGYVKGNGTTVEISNYNFIDENPINGMNYYRLKQMDFNNQFEYSDIRSVKFGNDDTKIMSIYPNPVQNKLTVSEGIGNITIFNAIGQPIKQIINESETIFSIDVYDLPQGIYSLQLQKANGQVVTKQFVK